MEENKERDRKGAFLIIISIATLIVAIIGATFAYFTATANSAENIVNLTAFEFNASLVVEKVAPSGDVTNLIPIVPGENIANVISLANNGANQGACIDVKGYTGCAVYHVTITNNSTKDALALKGSLKSTNNNSYSNLKLSFLTIDTNNNNAYVASGNVISIDATNGNSTELGTHNVGVGDQIDLYFVIYLYDTNSAQNEEMGQTFLGQLIFESTTGAQGRLTAQITA